MFMRDIYFVVIGKHIRTINALEFSEEEDSKDLDYTSSLQKVTIIQCHHKLNECQSYLKSYLEPKVEEIEKMNLKLALENAEIKKTLKKTEDLKRIVEEQEETKKILKKTDEVMKHSEIYLMKIEEHKETKEILEIMKSKLKAIPNELNDFFDIVFNENVGHYKLFTDINGKNKAFVIPLSAMSNRYTFVESVNLCKNFNSTLIEIESSEKQLVVESFLRRLGSISDGFQYFFINAVKTSSGWFYDEWKWLTSNTELDFTNWRLDEPSSQSDYNYIVVLTYSAESFGKWSTSSKTSAQSVICERTFGF